MAALKQLVKTLGLAYNVTDTIAFGQLSKNWKFSHEPTTEEVNYADRFGKKTLPAGVNSKFEAELGELTAAWIARMTGGSVANGLLRHVKERITRSSNTITLTYGGGANQAIVGNPVLVKDITNNTIRTQSGSATANDTYTRSTNVLTVHASDSGTDFEVSYYYTDTSASIGSKIIIPSQTLPGLVRTLLPYAFIPVTGGSITKYCVIDCQKSQPVSGITIGGEVQSFTGCPFNCAVLNEADGDLVIYTDSLNDLG